MTRIWGKLIKDNKIIKDDVAVFKNKDNYQQNLKECIIELCSKFDISKPYWLPSNMEEYNKRTKTVFTQDNFIEEINFDKFIIEELRDKIDLDV